MVVKRTLSLTIAKKGKNKCNPATLKWMTVDSWTVSQLFEHATKGYAFAVSVFHDAKRRKSDFLMAWIVGLDFDALTPETADDLLNNSFVKQHASFIYSTPSHTLENPRLRIVFILDQAVHDVDYFEAVIRKVMYALRDYLPDSACKDVARFFYGNDKPDFKYTLMLGNVLPLSVVSHLPDPDKQQSQETNNTNELPAELISDIESKLKFTDRKHGDFLECHCPIHPPDTEPSAGWHPEKKILYCFHENRTYLAVEVARMLGITMSYTVVQRTTNDGCLHCKPTCEHCLQPENITEPLRIDADFPEIPTETIVWYLSQNEYGDAQLLIRLTENRIIYDQSEKTWYWWKGHIWVQDRLNKTPELIYAPVGEAYAKTAGIYTTLLLNLEANPDANEAEIERLAKIKNELEKRTRALRSYGRNTNILKITSSLRSVAGNEWDRHSHLLGVQNGIVDLTQGKLIPGNMDELIRKVASVDFTPDTDATRWEQFLLEITGGDVEVVAFLQRLLGYCITGNTKDHILPVFYGRGRNGKDTFIETIGYVLGDYASAGTSDLLIEQSGYSGQANPHIFNLMGKRVVWVTETSEGSHLNVNQVKYLTGAGRLVARPLYGNPVEFDATHHIILFTNHKPRVPSESEDYAIWKRLILVPLSFSFVDNPTRPNERQRDPELKDKLRAEAEGILVWLVEGCLEWQKQGLNPPDSIRNATREYARSEDIIGLFIEECCEISSDGEIPASDLLEAYNQWAIQNGYPSLSARKLSDRVTQDFEKTRISRGMVYRGLKLRD